MVNSQDMAIPTPMMPDFRVNPLVFFREVKAELAKVIWPTRDEVIKLTLIVIGISAAIGFYIGGLDLVFTRITDLVIKAR